MKYKGFEIKKIVYQDCINYVVPFLSREDIAVNVKTAKKWIDAYIAEKNSVLHTYKGNVISDRKFSFLED